MFTVLVGVLFIAFFPLSSANPVSILGIRYFTERESQILQQRVLRDDPTKGQPRQNVTWGEIKATVGPPELVQVPTRTSLTHSTLQLTNWRLLPHFFMTILGMAPASTMGSYAPLMVVSFGFDRLKSNAMLSIGAWFLLLTNLLWGFVADKTKLRGPMVFLGVLILWGLTVSPSPRHSSSLPRVSNLERSG